MEKSIVKQTKSLNEIIPILELNLKLQVIAAKNSGKGNSEKDPVNYEVAIPYLIGPPGGGKTAIIKELCEKNNWKIYSVHLGLMPLEELSGIPKFTTEKIKEKEIVGTVWSIPEIMTNIYKLSENCKDDEIVVLFCDDMHLAGPTIMSLMYRFLTEREIKNFKLPENVAIIMAGNEGNKTGAKTIYSAICNRIAMLYVHTDIDDWKINFAFKNKVHSAIVSFLIQNSQHFHGEELVDSPWPSPRSWTKFSNLLTVYESQFGTIPVDLCQYLATAHVGREAAAEFTKYYHLFMKFNIEDIIKNYKDFSIENSNYSESDLYILALAITSKLTSLKKPDYKKFAVIFAEFIRNRAELGTIMLKQIEAFERATGARNVYSNILLAIAEIDSNLVTELIGRLQDAMDS